MTSLHHPIPLTVPFHHHGQSNTLKLNPHRTPFHEPAPPNRTWKPNTIHHQTIMTNNTAHTSTARSSIARSSIARSHSPASQTANKLIQHLSLHSASAIIP